MKLFKSALAGTAAIAMLAPQATLAAARTGTPIGESESQAELTSSAAPFLAVFGIFALVGLVELVSGGDDEETPTSP